MKWFQMMVAVCLAHYLGCSLAFAHPQTDKVIFENGDELTGEIKGLELSDLSFDADGTGTISTKWRKVKFLTSTEQLDVELSNGRRLFGSLGATDQPGHILIVSEQGSVLVPRENVAQITPIKKSFWDRVDGNTGLGFSYTKASRVGQFSLSSSTTYRTRKWNTALDLSAILTTQQEQDDQSRINTTYSYTRFLPRRFFIRGFTGYSRNTELGIQHRWSLGAGPGLKLVHTIHHLLAFMTGPMATMEWRSALPKTTSAEWVGKLIYEWRDKRTPKTEIDASVQAIPGLTFWGRVRLESNIVCRQEIVADFSLELKNYVSYDNRPPEGSSELDYGIIFGVAYSY